MSNGVERRAQIDTELFKALLYLNGGGVVALLAFLPTVIDKPNYARLAAGILWGLPLFMVGLVCALIHLRYRRLCSLEFSRHNNKPPPGQIWGFQLKEPRVCWISIRWMWGSVLAFLSAGMVITTNGLFTIYALPFPKLEFATSAWLSSGLTSIGLALDIIGAIVLAVGLFVTNEQAVELTASRWAGDSMEENLQHPQAQDRLRQSRLAKVGLAFLTAGFLLQIVAVWV